MGNPLYTFSRDMKQVLFSFDGRIARSTYWAGLVSSLLVGNILYFLMHLLFGGGAGLVTLLWSWTLLAIQAKRWHDMGRSGWWALTTFVPIINIICLVIILGMIDGDSEDNQYGSFVP